MAETGWGIICIEEEKPSKSKKEKLGNQLTLVSYGCIKTLVDHTIPKRLLLLKEQLGDVIKKHKPDQAAVEQLFFGQNSKTAMMVSQARGVLIVTIAEAQMPVFEYQGLKVKLGLTGNGRAEKNLVQEKVKIMLNLKDSPKPQHAADALAMAIYHARSL